MSAPLLAGTAAGYDAVATAYAEHLSHELDHKPFDRDFLARFTASLPAGAVLDLGCGPGHIGRHLHDLDRARPVSGLDLSPAMVALARERHPQLDVHLGDMRALPFAAASFAGVVAFYSIIHLDADDLAGAFAEMRRVLVAGGVLALSFHVGNEVRVVDALWGVKTCLQFNFFELATIAPALAAAGFRLIESSTRPPYDATVEAQTRRCYLLAQAADA